MHTSPVHAQDAQAQAPEGNGGGDAPAASGGQKNALFWLFESLGLLYIVLFLLLSFIFVALVIMNLLTARRESMCPVHLIQGFEACLNEQKYQEAYELAKADESVLGNVLSAGLAKLSSGYEQAVEAMQEVGEEENMKLEHRLSYINLVAQIAPMVGLFGTVHGMIDSFYVIANGGGTPDPNKLADGISKALVTTLIGLMIAIPAMAVFRILFNRVQRLVLEIGITSEGLMSRFQTTSPKAATAPKA
ncbi:MAG: MotA/TolQ/ExbB proton channel family protein [Pirellulaceae bacterium]